MPAVLFVVALAFFVLAGNIEAPGIQGEQLAPSFWPRAILLGLMAACAAEIVRLRRYANADLGRARRKAEAAAAQDGRVLFSAISLIVGYVLLIKLLGFALASLVFVVGFIYLAGWRHVMRLLVLATGGVVSILYLFTKVVYLPLPRGQGPFEDLTIALYRLLGIF